MRRVYMSFMAREAWFCHFLEEDLKTPLPRKLTLANPDKILELARRGGATIDLEAQQAIHHALQIGRGGVWLNLTEDQYQKLKLDSSHE
jgi:hypothetical protein